MAKRLTKMNKTVIEAALWFLDAGEFDAQTHGFTGKELQDAINAVGEWNTYTSDELDKMFGRGTDEE